MKHLVVLMLSLGFATTLALGIVAPEPSIDYLYWWYIGLITGSVILALCKAISKSFASGSFSLWRLIATTFDNAFLYFLKGAGCYLAGGMLALSLGVFFELGWFAGLIVLVFALGMNYVVLLVAGFFGGFPDSEKENSNEIPDFQQSTSESAQTESDEIIARKFLELPTVGKLDSGHLKFAYRRMRQRYHPDKGGNADDFIRTKWAYDILKKEI